MPPRIAAGSGLHRCGRGFSLFELVVVVCLIAILFTVAADRLWQLQVSAEKAAMDSVVGTLRSALGMKVAQLFVRNDAAGLQALQGSNPMALLAETPGNYLAEQPAGGSPRGSWYYDAVSRELVYRVKNEAYFRGPDGRPEARFRVRVTYDDRNRNGRFDAGREGITGVRLTEVGQYAWTE